MNDQTELLSLYLKRDIVKQEIDRLKPVGYSIAPRAQRENEFKKSQSDAAIEALTGAANTGKIGDGKIFVSPVEIVVGIRTEEYIEE